MTMENNSTIIMKHTIIWLNEEAQQGNQAAIDMLNASEGKTIDIRETYVVLTDKEA